MRGELDELTTSGQGSGGGDEAQPPARPPGGKALLRLLAILERDGLDSAAAESVGMAVPDEDRGGVVSLLEGMTASPFDAPLGERLAAIPGIPGEVAPEADSDGARLAEAIAAAVTDLGPPTATGPQWRSLGPWTIPNGQTYGSSRVNVSGRVACVAVDPSDAAHVLVGAAQGGVWESRNRGGAWAPRSDFAETLAVGAIAFDQRNPRVVYCGLGEGNFYWWMGRGILRSTDGGASWSTLCTAPFVGQGFHTLHVDANDSQHLVAGTTHGLYVSNDGGVTWTRRRSARTWSVSWAPTGGAAAEILAGCSDGVWRSTDGGATWAAQSLPGAPS